MRGNNNEYGGLETIVFILFLAAVATLVYINGANTHLGTPASSDTYGTPFNSNTQSANSFVSDLTQKSTNINVGIVWITAAFAIIAGVVFLIRAIMKTGGPYYPSGGRSR